MSQELIQGFRQQLEQFYQADVTASEALRKSVLAKVEATRQMGQIVQSARHDLRDDQFKSVTDFLDQQAVNLH